MSEFFKKLTVLEKNGENQKNAEVGFVETLVQRYTFRILFFFTLVLASKQHFGSPIHCQVPAESPGSWVKYYHDFCYYQDKYRIWGEPVKNTSTSRIVPIEKVSPLSHLKKDIVPAMRVTYYQWIPYILFLQAYLCLIPSLLWMFIGQKVGNGADIRSVVMEAQRAPELKVDERVACVEKIVKFIMEILHNKNGSGNSLTMLIFTFVKWCNFFMIVAQLYILSSFVGNGYVFWGFDLLEHVIRADGELYSGYFPRIVQCEVQQKDIANENNNVMMCLLSQNFICEKMLVFLYFWFLMIAVISFWISMRYSLLLICNSYRRFVTSALLPTKEVMSTKAIRDIVDIRSVCAPTSQLLDYFIDFLGCDGSLIMMLINDQSDPLVAFEVAQLLWKQSVQPAEIVDNILNKRACARGEDEPADSQGAPTGNEKMPLISPDTSGSYTLPSSRLVDHDVLSILSEAEEPRIERIQDEATARDAPDHFRCSAP